MALRLVDSTVQELPSDADIARYLGKDRAQNTLEAYASDVRHFDAWCESAGLRSLPASPETVVLYLVAHAARFRPGTLQRRVLSIARAHESAGLPPPNGPKVREVLGGIRTQHGTPVVKRRALLVEDLRQVVDHLPDTMIGRRDKALLLLGWGGALRRSELAALDIEDVTEEGQGLVVLIRKSKTDQVGEGQRIGISRARNARYCPVAAISTWKEHAQLTEGALLRQVDRHGNVGGRISGCSICAVVKRSVARVGLEPSIYGAHSLRSGLVTSARIAGAELPEIMRQTRHKSEKVAMGYIQEADLFRRNLLAITGL